MSLIRVVTNGRVAQVVINRPEKKNALSPDVIREMESALKSLKDVRVIVVRGEGGFFSAGGDLSVMLSASEGDRKQFSKSGNDFMDFLQDFGAITIAAIEGGAYGGGLELALSCDLRVASPQTKMGLTEVNLGLIPGWGGMKRIARIAGNGVARYVALTGRVMDGNEAYRLGLIHYLADNPVNFSEELAASLSQKSIDSVRAIKSLLGKEPYSSELEASLFGQVLGTQNARSTLEKFLKK
ncbi:MAG: enoyl-CoA hydratase/isomerase family protein [Thermoplasmatales archaeon]